MTFLQLTDRAHRFDASQFLLVALLLSYLVPGTLLGTNFAAPALQSVCLVFCAILNLDVRGPSRAILTGCAFAVTMIVLTIVAILIDFDRTITRDYIELGKYGLIALAYVVGVQLSASDGLDEKLVNACLIAAFLFAALGLLESVHDESGALIKALYGRDLAILAGKPILSFWSTYFAASMYAFLASILIGRVATAQTNWLIHLAIGLLLMLILLTQSRTGFMALGLLALAYIAAIIARRQYAFLATLLVAVVIMGLMTALVWREQLTTRFAYLWYGLQNYVLGFAQNVGGENSLGYRVNQIQWSIDNNRNVFFGAGIGKMYQPYLESFLSLFYYRYGLTGIALYALLWGAPIVYLALGLITRQGRMTTVTAGMGIFCATLPALSVSSVITDQIHFLFVYYLALGLWYGIVFVKALKADAEICASSPERLG